MSIKTGYFNTSMKIGSAVRYTYVVNIPGFRSLSFLVSSAPVPTPSRGTSQMSYMGETYSFPSSVELSSGDWSATLYETGLMEVMHAFYHSFTHGLSDPMFDVDIYAYQGDYSFYVHTRLLNCWVRSCSAPSLDGSATSDVATCTLTLAYNGIEFVENVWNNPVVNLLKYSALHLAAKAGSKRGGILDKLSSIVGVDTDFQTKAKEANLVSSNVVGGAKLLNALITTSL